MVLLIQNQLGTRGLKCTLWPPERFFMVGEKCKINSLFFQSLNILIKIMFFLGKQQQQQATAKSFMGIYIFIFYIYIYIFVFYKCIIFYKKILLSTVNYKSIISTVEKVKLHIEKITQEL